MIPEATLKKIQHFHFRTRRQANALFSGQYESAFKGRGMEFAEVREYQVGDDIRTIDWNVSARFGHPFVKVFHEERELTVILALDLSGSHLFGTRERFKRELLAEAAAMLAFLAIRTNDKVGAILFSSRVEKFIPPKKGRGHVRNQRSARTGCDCHRRGTRPGSRFCDPLGAPRRIGFGQQSSTRRFGCPRLSRPGG